MILYPFIILSLLIIYSLLIVAFMVGWLKIPTHTVNGKNTLQQHTKISVVIAFRNEENNLPSLLNSLRLQDYPTKDYEIILINDHSEDNGVELLKKEFAKLPKLNLLHLPEGVNGKKEAVQLGFKQARGELIVTTDADCIVPPKWLSVYNEFYIAQHKPDMIIGLVDLITSSSILKKIFRLEFLSLIASSAGASGINRPVFNNAANLAIKAECVKSDLDLKKKLVSGDDVFLLHQFKMNQLIIKLLKCKDHLVKSQAPEGLGEFFSQRVRWASKAVAYRDKDTILVSWVIFATNLGLLSSYFIFPLARNFFPLIIAWGIKLTVDISVFILHKKHFELKLADFLLVPIIELFYPIYIVISAISGKLKPFQWKGRSITIS